MSSIKVKQLKVFGILIFGLISPTAILSAAYFQLNKSTELIDADTSIAAVTANFAEVQEKLKYFNEYTLFSLMLVEANNLKSIINKQHMKNTVVHIGFATISLGLAFVLLGIKEEKGGGSVSMNSMAVSFDMKTGSTGAYVFVVGALMATVGGSLPNQYKGSGIPVYDKDQFKDETQRLVYIGIKAQSIKSHCENQADADRCVSEKLASLLEGE